VAVVDFAEMLVDSWGYTSHGVIGNTTRWMKLIVCVLCLGIPFNGYILRVYRGTTPAPEVDNWGTLFIDGLKVLAISIVYILPFILILILVFGIMIIASPGGIQDESGIAGGLFESLFTLLVYFIQFVIAAILPVAYIRFARTGAFFEAFNFGAIKETIGKIGWLTYVVAVVFIALITGIPLTIVLFGLIIALLFALALLGSNIFAVAAILAIIGIFLLIFIPILGVFQARYLTRLYAVSGE
jgi:hypothetical protein